MKKINNERIKEKHCFKCNKTKSIEQFLCYGSPRNACFKCVSDYHNIAHKNKRLKLPPPPKIIFHPKEILKEKSCIKCGKIKTIQSFLKKCKDGTKIYELEKCYECIREYQKDYKEKKRIEKDKKAEIVLINKCIKCGEGKSIDNFCITD